MAHDAAALIAALRAMIARESEAIRRGLFDDLPGIAARKASLIEALAPMAGGTSTCNLAGLRSAVEENERLLAAALRGFADARARLLAIHGAGVRLDTYDSHGRAQRVTLGGGQVERRA